MTGLCPPVPKGALFSPGGDSTESGHETEMDQVIMVVSDEHGSGGGDPARAAIARTRDGPIIMGSKANPIHENLPEFIMGDPT
jgi:hypothetical protein